MNTEMMLRVAAAIESEPERFDMGCWIESSSETLCGTVGCIAGTAVAVDLGREPLISTHLIGILIEQRAAKLLGLDYHEAAQLFTNRDEWWTKALASLGLWAHENRVTLGDISAKMASEVLRALVNGEVHLETAREYNDRVIKENL